VKGFEVKVLMLCRIYIFIYKREASMTKWLTISFGSRRS
jgi:hypothetical protein